MGSDDFKALRRRTSARCAVRISMKITEDVRNYAAEQGIFRRRSVGGRHETEANEFANAGAAIYSKA